MNVNTDGIRPISSRRLDPNRFKNIERLKEILKEAEPLHRKMVSLTEKMASLTEEYGEAVCHIQAVASALENRDGRGD